MSEVTESNLFQQLAEAPPPLQITADNTALLVVDMQYFDAHREWGEGRTAIELGVSQCFAPYFEQIDTIIPRIQQLLSLFRGKSMEVIHLRVSELTADSRDVGWKQLVRGLVVPAASREADPLDELAPIEDELVISKSSSGVFPTTNLDRLLRNMGITTLVMTGTSTGGCVESAVRDAVDLGYDVVVVTDACADATDESHRRALNRMAGGLTHLHSTLELAALIGELPGNDRRRHSGLERVTAFLPSGQAPAPETASNPYSLIFPPAVQLPLTRTNTALLLIDAQRFMCDPAFGWGPRARERGLFDNLGGYYERVGEALIEMRRLLDVSRAAGLSVIHVITAGKFADGRGLSRNACVRGVHVGTATPEAEIMPIVSPRPSEAVLGKPGIGAFTGTGLDELLRNLGVEHVILAGISCTGAIESTIRSATDRGYGAVLVPDACVTCDVMQQSELWNKEVGIIQVRSATDMSDWIAQL